MQDVDDVAGRQEILVRKRQRRAEQKKGNHDAILRGERLDLVAARTPGGSIGDGGLGLGLKF